MSKLHIILSFGLGVFTGAGAFYMIYSNKMRRKCEDEISSLKKVYRDELAKLRRFQKDTRTDAEILSEKYAASSQITEQSRSPFVEKNHVVPYHTMSDHPREEDIDSDGRPYDPEGVSLSEATLTDEEFQDAYIPPIPKDNRVFLIDEEQYAGDPQYEKFQIIYYEADGVWADSQDEVLQPSDFLSTNTELVREIQELLVTEDAVYVRNNGCLADYEIISLETSYVESVFGNGG